MDTIHHPKTAPEAPKNDLAALSPRELAARRANAAKSTGPRTDVGKSVASMNALKNGFFAHDVVNSLLDGTRPRRGIQHSPRRTPRRIQARNRPRAHPDRRSRR